MMRSLFSGVAGLKTHQTRMDVIGNNIANVNTTAYKSQNMVFSDLLYQTTQAASGANAATGRGGINARQIGLGSKTAAINTAITRQGSAQSTNNPWDIMITGESFFIVNSGSQNFFTRDGSFTIDGSGNLVMASTGYRVMGWQVDEETGEILSDVVSALQVMNRDNLIAEAESTTLAYAAGILDKNDTDVHSSAGQIMTLKFYDRLGYDYTAKFSIHALDQDGNYYVQLDDIINNDGVSLKKYYNVNDISQIATFGSDQSIDETKVFPLPADGSVIYQDGEVTGVDGSLGVFQVNYNLDKILDGYGNNVMMNMLENPKVTAIEDATLAPGTTVSVDAGKEVTITGEVTLTRDILQSDYGVTYDEVAKRYYYNKPADPPTDPQTYNRTDIGPSDPEATTAEMAEWESILSALGGDVDLTSLKPDDDNPVNVRVEFSAKFTTKEDSSYNVDAGKFGVQLIYPTQNDLILENAYGLKNTDNKTYSINYVTPDGHASIAYSQKYNGNALVFDTQTGKFNYVGGPEQNSVTLNFNAFATDLAGTNVDLGHFTDIDIDFSSVTNINNGKVSTVGLDSGDGGPNNIGAGRKYGELIGIEVGQDGKLRASYDNGMTKLLGQIAVAKFANPAGLAKAGNNLYSTTMNSGDFDGIGEDITADGEGSMESGLLEMSNVDLAGEFTEMITTQRGFQANSRIITTSDTLLEELVNLKR